MRPWMRTFVAPESKVRRISSPDGNPSRFVLKVEGKASNCAGGTGVLRDVLKESVRRGVCARRITVDPLVAIHNVHAATATMTVRDEVIAACFLGFASVRSDDGSPHSFEPDLPFNHVMIQCSRPNACHPDHLPYDLGDLTERRFGQRVARNRYDLKNV